MSVQTLSRLFGAALLAALLGLPAPAAAQTPYQPYLMNEIVDLSQDFHDFGNGYYLADSLASFDPATASGTIRYRRHEYVTQMAFNNILAVLQPRNEAVFPGGEYAVAPEQPFSLSFVSPRTVRLRVHTRPEYHAEEPSLMLVGGTAPQDATAWRYDAVEGGHRYTSAHGSVTVFTYPWRIEFRDAEGRLLTRTVHQQDNRSYTPSLPFSFMRRAADYQQWMAATFELAPGEKIFGTGESFTALDKRGQKVILFTDDANGAENMAMYKPIPFFMSNRGYGMFLHETAPMTLDFGVDFNGHSTLLLGDDDLDLFVFLGQPRDILDAYTDLTGKAPMPPLWSFGTWMSRISYFSEAEVRDVAARLREHRIPSDVIHLDTGWFETDWRTDYRFAPSRFEDPQQMIDDLKAQGFHISLWQLPYFVPKNRLFPEIVSRGLAVRDAEGDLPYEDAILDFSNPEAIDWYAEQIGHLLQMGVGAIKVDFGEAAPLTGLYHSGRTGWYEHNLYPLRYNKVVAEVTKAITGEQIMWARSAWAGSQRYPVHWGGDAATSDNGMAATLRGGLSLGLSGFTFWSHDIGGFTAPPPESLYRRWTPFGFLSSHTRSHGQPPREPWLFSEALLNDYRRAAELKYRLMPYVYAQARHSADHGLPMVRALFVEYPDDPGSWLVEDQYLFGQDILVAPLLEESSGRDVYLPPGTWIDYQTGAVYAGGWHSIEAGPIPVIMLVRDGAVLPHIGLAQSTRDLDWSRLDLVVFTTDDRPAEGFVALPPEATLHTLSLTAENGTYRLANDPLDGQVRWTITRHTSYQGH